jgi:hypothetical protein
MPVVVRLLRPFVGGVPDLAVFVSSFRAIGEVGMSTGSLDGTGVS